MVSGQQSSLTDFLVHLQTLHAGGARGKNMGLSETLKLKTNQPTNISVRLVDLVSTGLSPTPQSHCQLPASGSQLRHDKSEIQSI